ncbi:hypothetical protein HDV00_010979 [Rhizophlyctis rosea]|nr:hypothetical protein HDV00_010979 [Rhizophlyctis rosea]
MEGSVYSKVMQFYERQILECMESFFIERGYDPAILCFDGLQVLKDNEKPLDENIIPELEKHIADTTTWRMKVASKQMIVSREFLDTLRIQSLPTTAELIGDVTTPLFELPIHDDNLVLDQLAKEAIMHRTHNVIAKYLFLKWENEFYYKDGVWWYFFKSSLEPPQW